MGGPNLEVFKFGLYLFVPVFALLHFGDPNWYHNHVLPVSAELNFVMLRMKS
jgi:protein PET100, fungi type